MAGQSQALPDASLHYFTNSLGDTFHLEGAPLRFHLWSSKNPYAGK